MRNLGSHNPQEPFLATPRRRFLSLAIGWLGFGRSASWGREVAADASTVRAHALGLLYGSVLGDALGGPIEFLDADTTTGLCGARRWPDDRRLTPDIRGTLASTIPLLDYARLRPDPAPYGPWRRSARPGTITDDTRHKIVLLRALRRSLEAHRSLTAEDIALGFLEFRPEGMDAASIETLVEEGLREYRLAARWILGERDRSVARPVERLWGGVDNCSGQMMFPPLAIAWAGMPVRAYEQTFALDFIDTPMAKDITAAIVAGLSAVVGTESLDLSPEQRWRLLLDTMRRTDPYGFGQVPFAGRQLDRWMDAAERFARASDGRPKRLYHLLETEGQPTYWWDAHFTLLVPLSMLHLTNFDPLAALHLTLDFGHDTDSYAQLLGAWIGAVHGVDLFPDRWKRAVDAGLQRDYSERIEEWVHRLEQVRDHAAASDR